MATFIRSLTGATSGSQFSSITFGTAAPVSRSNALVLFGSMASGNGGVGHAAVTSDIAGTLFERHAHGKGAHNDPGWFEHSQIWAAVDVPAGAHTVTTDVGAGHSEFGHLTLTEWSKVALVSPLDVAAAKQGRTNDGQTDTATSTASTTGADDVLLGLFAAAGQGTDTGITTPSGHTSLSLATATASGAHARSHSYRLLSATGVQSATWGNVAHTATSHNWWSTALVALKSEPDTLATKARFLTSAATVAPFPTTSRLLSDTAGASEVRHDPGFFDSGQPGASDAGQFMPGTANKAATTLAVEIDNTGTAPGTSGTTRQGWLWDINLTDYQIWSGDSFSVTLRLIAGLVGVGRPMLRATIVTASGGVLTHVKDLLATRVTGGAPTAGQVGWRDADARINVASTTAAANFTFTLPISQNHKFTAGQYIFFELGFCDADSLTDRAWSLLFNNAVSAITTPGLTGGPVAPAPAALRRVMLIS